MCEDCFHTGYIKQCTICEIYIERIYKNEYKSKNINKRKVKSKQERKKLKKEAEKHGVELNRMGELVDTNNEGFFSGLLSQFF